MAARARKAVSAARDQAGVISIADVLQARESKARATAIQEAHSGASSVFANAGVAKLGMSPFVQAFEHQLQVLCSAARTLPALTAENAHEERARLTACLNRGDALLPRFSLDSKPVPHAAFRALDELRRQAHDLPCPTLYLDKLDELELDLMLIDALGRPRAVRPLAKRRYGTGATIVATEVGPVALERCARILLDRAEPSPEPKELLPDGEPASVGKLVRALARAIGLPVEVRVEPRLASGAAAGEHTVFVASRRFGRVEAERLAVHEVLGHLVAAHNGRLQPLRLFEWGTAGSFADQEGVALYLEAKHGVMDGTRMRVLGGRVLATDWMHAGASFSETAYKLLLEERFTPAEAIAIAERAYRGGGVARDASYLLGYLRVQHAIANGDATLDELRAGRVSVAAVPAMRLVLNELRVQGYVAEPLLRPNLSRNFLATKSVTTPRTSPPSDAASLIKLELTKK